MLHRTHGIICFLKRIHHAEAFPAQQILILIIGCFQQFLIIFFLNHHLNKFDVLRRLFKIRSGFFVSALPPIKLFSSVIFSICRRFNLYRRKLCLVLCKILFFFNLLPFLKRPHVLKSKHIVLHLHTDIDPFFHVPYLLLPLILFSKTCDDFIICLIPVA